MFDAADAAMVEMGIPDAFRQEILRRLKTTIKRRTEHLTDAQLTRSGFKWGTLFGAVHEDVIASNKELWKEIGEFATNDVRGINALLSQGGKALVNGKGEPIAPLRGVPRKFPERLEFASDIWLVPPSKGTPDLEKMALDPEAFGGKQFTDRSLVSFAGRKPNRGMAAGAEAEIKVPKKKPKAGPQFAKAKPRRARAGYQVMSIEDGKGNVIRREVIPVEQIVLNPSSVTSYALTSSTTGLAGFVLKAPRGASGLKQMHWRYTAAVHIELTERILKVMLSRRTLRGAKKRR